MEKKPFSLELKFPGHFYDGDTVSTPFSQRGTHALVCFTNSCIGPSKPKWLLIELKTSRIKKLKVPEQVSAFRFSRTSNLTIFACSRRQDVFWVDCYNIAPDLSLCYQRRVASYKTKLKPLSRVVLKATRFGFYSLVQRWGFSLNPKHRNLEAMVIEDNETFPQMRTANLYICPDVNTFLKRTMPQRLNILFHIFKAKRNLYYLAKVDFLKAKSTMVTGHSQSLSAFEIGTNFAAVKTEKYTLELTNLHSSKKTCRFNLKDLKDNFHYRGYWSYPLRIQGSKLYVILPSFKLCQFDISTGKASFVLLRKFWKARSLLDDLAVEILEVDCIQIRQNIPIEVRLREEPAQTGKLVEVKSCPPKSICGLDFQVTGNSQKVILKSLFWDSHSERLFALLTLCAIKDADPNMQFHLRIANGGSEFKSTIKVHVSSKFGLFGSYYFAYNPDYLYLLVSFDIAMQSVQHCVFKSTMRLKIVTVIENVVHFKKEADHGDSDGCEFDGDDESDDRGSDWDTDDEEEEDTWEIDYDCSDEEHKEENDSDENEKEDDDDEDEINLTPKKCLDKSVVEPKVDSQNAQTEMVKNNFFRIKLDWTTLPAELNVNFGEVTGAEGTLRLITSRTDLGHSKYRLCIFLQHLQTLPVCDREILRRDRSSGLAIGGRL